MTMAKVRAKVAARKVQLIAGRDSETRIDKALSLASRCTIPVAPAIITVKRKKEKTPGVYCALARQKVRGKSIPLI